ncbi:uncharacterized protein LOC107037989 [Diachasma alloeum]|uniref:uncharacterized protein LOC107037989 n=1 Tax=Diachasma alloeum TaxID=454923 RepID=UPI0007381D4F|nr:uncharacterized protein LOC107037989 [Diachasma alloeum]
MAPTICMADIPKAGTGAPCVRRKYWQERAINRHSRVELKQISVKNGNWEANCQELSLPEARIPEEPKQEQLRILERRRKELLDIVIRTLILVRRNHVLQKRVDALCLETQHFIRSQLRNRQPKTEVGDASKEAGTVSSSTDAMEVDNTRQSNNNESEIMSPNHVTSTCISSDTDSGVSSDCSF